MPSHRSREDTRLRHPAVAATAQKTTAAASAIAGAAAACVESISCRP
jgi:hypothetical protein